MLVKDVATIDPIEAGDGTELREILHPIRDGVHLGYSLALALLHPGEASRRHKLAASEVYYVLYGTGLMHVGDESETVEAGQTVYIPAGEVQWIKNEAGVDLAFLCIVDPPWRSEDEEVIE
jgi:mannose-6-phosphate isomerase-like protein (cupin superfamily)